MPCLINEKTLKSYIKLGRAGDCETQYQLGLFYEEHNDLDLAIYWIRLAYLGGYELASTWFFLHNIDINEL